MIKGLVYWEFVISRVVDLIPLSVLNRCIKIIPKNFLALLINSLQEVSIYPISMFGAEFLIESGPRDDHYLELKKDNLKVWESDALKLWCEELNSEGIIIDVGAYLGIYSIVAAKLGARKVISIEPNQRVFQQLKRNLDLNACAPIVEIYEVAVGAEETEVSLVTPKNRPFSSAAKILNPGGKETPREIKQSLKVPMTTLNSLLADNHDQVSIIKIDAEGYELSVLRGATSILSLSAPAMIIEVLSLEQKNKVDNFLSSYGYRQGQLIEKIGKPKNYFYESRR
jgi:FkbM family methyltransferase